MSQLVGARRSRVTAVLVGLALVACLAAVSTAPIDTDGGGDLAGALTSVAEHLARLRWQFVACVLVLTCLHYVAAALAVRAAASMTPLPLRETVLVQLAAATANRIIPGGLGGAAVNARFFTRRGIEGRAAIGTVATLTVLAAAAHVIAFGLLLFLGRVFGLGGGPRELHLLGSRVARLGSVHSVWTWALVSIVVVGVAYSVRRHLRKPTRARFSAPMGAVLRRPKCLATLLVASGSTSVILAFAFLASVQILPGPQPQAPAGAIVIAFIAASAVATAVPIPSGIGSTEGAMVAVLVTAQVPTTNALAAVLAFRVITFWLPAVAGLIATRHLRRSGAL
jgi:uncharacterized membrane protein YbhN (UPF0104 family)